MSLHEVMAATRDQICAGHHRVLLAGGPDLIRGVMHSLDSVGITAVEERNGNRAIERLLTELFDAAIIDLDLPPFDDFSVVSSWGLTDIPIIAITSRVDAADAIAALEMGADDYLKQPYLSAELLARLRALLRRTSPAPPPIEDEAVISAGRLTIDARAFQVWKSGTEVSLSVTEFKLLLALVRNAGRVLNREVLVQQAWGYEFLGSSRLVDMTIARLRSKIEDRPKEPEYVLTMRGIGYLFQVPRIDSRASETMPTLEMGQAKAPSRRTS